MDSKKVINIMARLEERAAMKNLLDFNALKKVIGSPTD